MSLLNDALRAAEQRQNRPNVAGAYTGQGQPAETPRRWIVPVLALLLIAAVAVAVYGLFFRAQVATVQASAPVESESARTAVPKPEAEAVAPDTVSTALEPAITPQSSSKPKPAPVAQAEPDAQSKPSGQPALETQPEPEEKTEQHSAEVTVTAPETSGETIKATQPLSTEPRPEPTPTPADAEPVTPTAKVAVTKPEAEAPAVKQVRETPATIDRRVSRDIARLLRAGEARQAEQALRNLLSAQAAPLSREAYARTMLLQDTPERALPWVSGAEAEAYPALRLLHARALLATGRLQEAVKTLIRDVPPVAQNTEYRITLATLLQQAGQNIEAARHWSALIAVDDSRPAWWVGLAIALEAQGEAAGAVKAYAQAAKLPGLSPSLADYVRNRLTLLQAG